MFLQLGVSYYGSVEDAEICYILIYKSILGLLPLHLLICIHQKSLGVLWSRDSFFLFKVRSEIRKRAFKFAAPLLCNHLQNHLKLKDNLTELTSSDFK